MKTFLLLTLVSFSAFAVEMKFVGPCEKDFIMKTEMPDDFANVGEVTIAALTKFNIPFKGTAEGLATAFDTPVGKDALEVVSPTEIRAYGWCFAVDGVAPDVYPNEIPLAGVKQITWTFGFARSVNGQWITQCTPSWSVRPDFLCKDPETGLLSK